MFFVNFRMKGFRFYRTSSWTQKWTPSLSVKLPTHHLTCQKPMFLFRSLPMVAHEDKKLSDWAEFCGQRKVSLHLCFATS